LKLSILILLLLLAFWLRIFFSLSQLEILFNQFLLILLKFNFELPSKLFVMSIPLVESMEACHQLEPARRCDAPFSEDVFGEESICETSCQKDYEEPATDAIWMNVVSHGDEWPIPTWEDTLNDLLDWDEDVTEITPWYMQHVVV